MMSLAKPLLIACFMFAVINTLATAQSPQTPSTSDAARIDAERAKQLLQAIEPGPTATNTAPVSKLGFVRTSLFGIEAEGAKFVYVMDRSASMSEPKQLPLIAAKRELQQSILPLGRVHQFYIVTYNHEARLFQPSGENGKLAFATEQNKTAAENFITAIAPDGGTDHYLALNMALKIRPDVIFLLTDGDANDDLTAEQLVQLEKQNNGICQIHVIQFSAGLPTGERIRNLAKQNRGEFKVVDVRELK